MAIHRGISGCGLGRTLGAQNLATREFKSWIHSLCSSAEFRAWVEVGVKNGTLPIPLMLYLMQMVYGKPRETVDLNVTVNDELASLSIEDLEARAKELASQLEEVRALEEALPAEFRRHLTTDVNVLDHPSNPEQTDADV